MHTCISGSSAPSSRNGRSGECLLVRISSSGSGMHRDVIAVLPVTNAFANTASVKPGIKAAATQSAFCLWQRQQSEMEGLKTSIGHMLTSVFLVADSVFIRKCLAQIQVHNAADLHEALSLASRTPCILLKDSTRCRDILLGNGRRLLCRAGILTCCMGSCTGESTYSKQSTQSQAC